ncbi:MAG TPA: hemolysin family protein [Anaerolineales bacterium]|nr:hemolysin family protein [Anaerolineales bacterium]
MTTEIIILILLIVANGIFAMSEMAVISARKARLRQRLDEGDRGAAIALTLAEKPTRFLSTVQMGMTLVGILSGAFGGATIAENLAGYFARIPALAPYSEAIGVGIVVLVITYFSLVIGELVPKRIALNNAERLASLLAPPLSVISQLARPAVSFLSFSTDTILRILGIRPGNEPAVTEEEVKILIDEGRQTGIFEDTEQKIVERVFRLSDRTVSSIMTHRSEMVWLDLEEPFEDNMKKIVESGHSNFVVCQGDLDHVVGIARAKDLVVDWANGKPTSLKMSPQMPPYVPENMNALDVVERLRKVKSPMALVVDEYGSIAGMVTFTDILEAIVGDIPGMDVEGDEPEAVQREDGSWLLDGMMSVDELEMLFDLDELPEEDINYETISGLFMAQLGRIPELGDFFEWERLRFEVIDMDGHRVDKVLVTPLQPPGLSSPNGNNQTD